MQAKQHTSSRWRRAGRWFKATCKAVFALLLVCLAGLIAFSAWALHEAGVKLDEIPALTDPNRAPLPQPIRVYSAEGVLLGQIAPQQRIVVNGGDIPDVVRHATIAIEDQRFYEHRGVDLQALLRAAWVDLKTQSASQGASTITMQYVRNVYLDFTKTAARKIQEAALALQLESMWTKQRILNAYLNTVYYGNGAYGIEAAARHYFNKPAKRLRPDQAALLAGITKDPSAYDPRRHPEAALKRRNLVLDEMFHQGYLTYHQVLKAKQRKLKLAPVPRNRRPREPQLLQFVLQELERTLTPLQRRRGGLRVHTSLKLEAIRKARRRLAEPFSSVPRPRPIVAASFVEAKTGRVLLVADSYNRGLFNYAVNARRQPGSTVKPFTVAALLTRGAQLTDPVDNSPLRVQDGRRSYVVQPTHAGASTIQDALRYSQNPAFWRLYQQAGPRRVLRLQRRLGLDGMDANPAAALGGVKYGASSLQMAGAFAAFADEGEYRRPHAIVRIEDFLGNVIYTDAEEKPRQVLAPEYARQLTVALQRTVSDGLAQLRTSLPLARKRPLAGKTGTTEDHADAWFAGYTPQLAGAVWTGYARSRRPLQNLPGGEVWGSTVPARAFNDIARELLKHEPVLHFPRPQYIQRIPQLRGKTRQQAAALLAQFRFTNPVFIPRFSARARSERVLSVDPPAGSWAKYGAPIRVVYAINQRPAPNLIGKSFLDALRTVGRFAELRPKMVVSDQPLGTVLSQSPWPGQMIKVGDRIEIEVATQPGPPQIKIKRVPYVPSDSELAQLRQQLEQTRGRVIIPDVVGLDIRAARQVLGSLGLRARRIGADATVAAQEPASGTPIHPGAAITLYMG